MLSPDERQILLEELNDPNAAALLPFRPPHLPASAPAPWRAALEASQPLEKLIELVWTPVERWLPLTVGQLRSKLGSIEVLTRTDGTCSLAYVFRQEAEPYLRIGPPPTTPAHAAARRLPSELLAFYNSVHDGWTDAFGTMGPLPGNRWPYLSYLAEPDATSAEFEMKPDQFLVIAESGSREFLGFDLVPTQPVPALWILGQPAQVVGDIMQMLDDWMSSDLEDFDPVRERPPSQSNGSNR